MKIKLYQCGNEHPKSEYPLGLGYLLSNCKHTEIVSDKTLLKDCDLIGLSTSADGLKEAIEILQSTKIPIVIGGQGTLWPDIINYDFRAIVIGDGEVPLSKIINGDTNRIFKHDIQHNIDTLIPPIRGRCNKIVPIITSRGCPYQCHFCSSNSFWGKVRFHSAEYVIEEVKMLLALYPTMKTLYILDDLFIANIERFNVIYESWMKHQWNKKLTLESFVRSNLFTKKIGLQMKRMGFKSVRFGAESGSNRMLQLLNKKTSVENHQRTIDIANEIKLPVTASFMYDLPNETTEDKQATLDFIQHNKHKLGVKGWYKFRAFPGTTYYNGEDMLSSNMKVR